MNFSPSAGHEMAGRHYALVMSPLAYARRMGMTIVCVITSRVRRYPYEVFLPDGLLPAKKGVGSVTSVVVADAVRQVDFREREMAYVADAPKELVEEVLDLLLTAMDEEQ
jgi:mRNA interferase MazF